MHVVRGQHVTLSTAADLWNSYGEISFLYVVPSKYALPAHADWGEAGYRWMG